MFRPTITGSFSIGSAENPTGVIMRAAFDAAGQDATYVNCEVPHADLAAAVEGARAMGWRGFNCSIPHKQSVIGLLDGLAPTASLCHAVNTVVRTQDGWIGHNTDGAGFVDGVDGVDGETVLVVGTGGAATAIAVECARRGAAALLITGRNADRVSAVVDVVDRAAGTALGVALPWSTPIVIPTTVSILVDATSVGMPPHDREEIPLDWSSAPGGLLVADVVIHPTPTMLLRSARARGLRTIDGRRMLVNQAAANIDLWFGFAADRAVMRAALDRVLADPGSTVAGAA